MRSVHAPCGLVVRRLPKLLADRFQEVLLRHLQETSFFQSKLCIYELEKYHYRWQERSEGLYRTAAAVAKVFE